MSKRRVLAVGGAMPGAIERRSVLAGLVSLTLPCSAEAKTGGSIDMLIDAHKAAYAEVSDSLNEADSVWCAQQRKPFTKAAERRNRRALEAEMHALSSICAYRPANETEQRSKGRYLLEFADELQEKELRLLLQAMAGKNA